MAEPSHDLGEARVDAVLFRDIRLHRDGLRAKAFGGSAHGIGFDVGQGHTGALGDIGAGEFQPDAACGAGDEGGLPCSLMSWTFHLQRNDKCGRGGVSAEPRHQDSARTRR